MRILPVLALAILINIPCLVSAQSPTQTDFDGDGVSDLTSVTSGASGFTWNATGSSDSTEKLAIVFGSTASNAAPAHWIDSTITSLGVVQLATQGKALVWKVLLDSGLLTQQEFGNSGDLYVAGADFDGNGISDAAVVRTSGNKLLWFVRLNMFASASSKKFKFGNVGDRAFFLSPDGVQDWAAVFGKANRRKARLSLRNVTSGEVITKKNFKKSFIASPRPRPFPIEGPDGVDAIGIVKSDASDTVLYVFDLDGEKIASPTFPGLGTMTVGNYSDDTDGEEIVFQSTSGIKIFNPFTNTVTTPSAVSGTILDEINIAVLALPTAVPASTPTPSNTPTVTITPTATN